MQKVLSSRSRMERVVEDIVFDFSVKPRLASERGNAILVASSIYEAAKYFELFEKTVFVALYKSTAALVRAFANIADDFPDAGYSDSQITRIKENVTRYLKLREIIRQASGETIDLKAYEADMRHLIDTYIQADEPRSISDFGEIGLLDLIVKSGIGEAIKNLPNGIKGNKDAVAETIANNVRSKIIKEHLNDPAFYLFC
jgi:hypothetical protein